VSETGPTGELPRQLQGSAYTDDDGTGDAALAVALTSYDAGTVPYPAVLAALADARLLVPVVALLGEVEHGDDGLARDKSSDMATVLMRGADGRQALLAFTDLAALARWDPQARPVPVTAVLAAQTAVQEGADAVVVDLAGPCRFVVSAGDLHRLAAGWRPVEVAGEGWAWLGRDGHADSPSTG
jgi:hypothetical protein